MGTFVIAGGNGGIGLEVGRELLGAGHRVILLGRENQKGEAALASLGAARERAEFLSVDLSTHDGVRDAARRIDERTDRIDGLLHSAAVFETRNVRTKDDLPLFVGLSYVGRYHLTQLLMPKLLLADNPRVMMFVATLNETPKIDLAPFPRFRDFNFLKSVVSLNGACLYYANYLTTTYPKLFAGCATPGFVRTGIFRNAPWYIKAYVAVVGPFTAISAQKAAHNVVQALRRAKGPAFNWNKPGDFESGFEIQADPAVQKVLIDQLHELTGV
ncbi:MAG TPA: SDR family NAD(P)-dependent oxidoreductase [Rhizomicrobium sp.]